MGRVKEWFFELVEAAQSGDSRAREVLRSNECPEFASPCFYSAEAYCSQLAWAIIPQQPGTKKPLIRWKVYKDEHRPPRVEQLREWYIRWPDAGVVVLLGPVSGLFAVDVDGKDAHDALVKRLGGVPRTVASWRGKRYRYHLLFRHPAGLATIAKFTPWHPGLEFRGHGGYVVVPPSLHESGTNYEWKPGRSPWDTPLARVPAAISRALKARCVYSESPRPRRARPEMTEPPGDVEVRLIPGIARATQLFLSGRYAFEGEWNRRLFHAACDLAGNHVEESQATELLLAGARPRDDSDQAKALATIKSAYSTDRFPARSYRPRKKIKRSNRATRCIGNRTIIRVDP